MSSGRRDRLRSALRARAVKALSGPELDARVRELARASRLTDHVVFGDPSRVSIGVQTELNDPLLNVISGRITIEPTAFLGRGVSLLTGTHDIELLGRQTAVPAEGRDIVIGRGAWLASNVTVLGPCTIGAHAVVAAGSVVTCDVAPGTVVAGAPARPTGRTIALPAVETRRC